MRIVDDDDNHGVCLGRIALTMFPITSKTDGLAFFQQLPVTFTEDFKLSLHNSQGGHFIQP
jgi:hypothetical protein